MGGIQPSNPQAKHTLFSSHYNFKHTSISQQYKWSEGKLSSAARSAAPRDALCRTNRYEWQRIHRSFLSEPILLKRWHVMAWIVFLQSVTLPRGLAPGFVFMFRYAREQKVEKRAVNSPRDWSANMETWPLSTSTYQMRIEGILVQSVILKNLTLWAYRRKRQRGSVSLRLKMSWRPWLQIMIYEMGGAWRGTQTANDVRHFTDSQ